MSDVDQQTGMTEEIGSDQWARYFGYDERPRISGTCNREGDGPFPIGQDGCAVCRLQIVPVRGDGRHFLLCSRENANGSASVD